MQNLELRPDEEFHGEVCKERHQRHSPEGSQKKLQEKSDFLFVE